MNSGHQMRETSEQTVNMVHTINVQLADYKIGCKISVIRVILAYNLFIQILESGMWSHTSCVLYKYMYN